VERNRHKQAHILGLKAWASRRAETAIDETNIDSFQGNFPRVPAIFNLFGCDEETATEAQYLFRVSG
jgi:hypothetical protein